jgi:hypothetical protein
MRVIEKIEEEPDYGFFMALFRAGAAFARGAETTTCLTSSADPRMAVRQA